MSRGRALAAAAGVAVIVWLVAEIGAAPLIASFSQLSWRIPLCFLPYALVAVLDAVGWRYAFPARMPGVPLLVAARLCGEAVNLTTPTATLGGEPLKAWLLARAHVPFEEGLVSVVVAKTALVVAHLGFVAFAVALAAQRAAAPPALLTAMAVVTLVGAVAIGGFVWTQQRGLFGASGRVLTWLGVGDRLAPHLARLDTELPRFYRERRARFGLSVLFHLLGWVAGGLEVWLALQLLGSSITFATAVLIEACATAIRSASFLVPAALGIQEGGLVAIFVGFGLDAGTGLAFGLIRRLREAAWAAVGFVILAAWRAAPGASTHGAPGSLP
jgi:putative membrane protein